jgi:hypothetical protein
VQRGVDGRQPRFVCEGMPDPNAPPPKVPEDTFSSTEIPWPNVRALKAYAFDPTLDKFVGN